MKNLAVLSVLTLAASVSTVIKVFSQEDTTLTLKPGTRIAVLGDNVTNQKAYVRYFETYLYACAGLRDVKVFQFGRDGETAEGAAKRLESEVLPWKPTLVTLQYGRHAMNVHPWDDSQALKYQQSLENMIDLCGKNNCRVMICSPVPVDTKFQANKDHIAEKINESLTQAGETGFKTAVERKTASADFNSIMLKLMKSSREKFGDKYHVTGQDGVYPWGNGHLIMAYVFLKKFHFTGQIASITLDMEGKDSAVSEGHKILAAAPAGLTVESTRYPFCMEDGRRMAKDPRDVASILEVLPFMEELSRFELKVKGLKAPKAKVNWGKESKEFSSEQLAKGINLAAEFLNNPFCDAFRSVANTVAAKERFEGDLFSYYMRVQRDASAVGISESGKQAFNTVIDELWKVDDLFYDKIFKCIVPVKHTIKITPVLSEPAASDKK